MVNIHKIWLCAGSISPGPDHSTRPGRQWARAGHSFSIVSTTYFILPISAEFERGVLYAHSWALADQSMTGASGLSDVDSSKKRRTETENSTAIPLSSKKCFTALLFFKFYIRFY
jgi:hypothetical protein